jgi:hypothetical protein
LTPSLPSVPPITKNNRLRMNTNPPQKQQPNPDQAKTARRMDKAMAKARVATMALDQQITQLMADKFNRMLQVVSGEMAEDALKEGIRFAIAELRQQVASLPEQKDPVAVSRSVNQLFNDFLAGLEDPAPQQPNGKDRN